MENLNSINKKEIFNEMNILSKKINYRIIKSGINFKDGYTGERNRELIELELDNDEKGIMILGLNPSINLGNGEGDFPDINFIKAINCDKKKIGNECEKYINQYHQQRYNYLCKGYSMMWEKDKYLNKYLDKYEDVENSEYKIKDKEKLRTYLWDHKMECKNYVIFTDLLHFKVTEAEQIKPFIQTKKKLNAILNKQGTKCGLSDEEYDSLQEDIFKLFLLQIQYYEPKLIWSNGEPIKEFLEKNLNRQQINLVGIYQRQYSKNKKDSIWKTEYNGIPLYFSKFYSNGSMTREEHAFLKQEIYKDLAKLDMLPSGEGCRCTDKK